MHILCPHCRNHIEVVQLKAHEEIHCSSCGSGFSLEAGPTATGAPPEQLKLGRFELLGVVGQGGFGTVYRARDTEMDRIVALKVPRAGNLPEGAELERFLREARSAAQLRHPSIVAVHEVGQQDGTPYLVSDFVEGVTLADHLTGRRLTFLESARLVEEVARAVQYAHERGVVHRDLKPSNIMLGEGGEAHVMDFGLAKREAGEITVTLDGQVLGTPAYMSPEQARGEGHKVDGRSDVYSLGVILYELLTGELPFRGNMRMLLHQVLHDEPRPPRRLNDAIPRDLETVALKCLQKEPGKRYGSALELAEDMGRFQRREPIRARPVGALERGLKWVRRNRAVSALAAAVFVALVAGAAVSGYFAYEADGRARSEGEAKQRAQAEANRADAQRRRVEGLAYAGNLARAQRAFADGDQPLAMAYLRACPPERRGWEHSLLWTQFNSEQTLWAPAGDVRFSPDGRRLVAHSAQSIQAWDAGTGRLLFRLDLDGTEVKVREAETGRAVRTLKGHHKAVVSLALSPDGSRIVTTADDRTTKVWDTASGREIRSLSHPAAGHSRVEFSPDGKRVVAHNDDFEDRKVVWDVQSGRVILELRKPREDRRGIWDLSQPKFELRERTGLAFSPDGRRIAAPAGNQEVAVFDPKPASNKDVAVWDAETGKRLLLLQGHAAAVTRVEFAAGGRRIVSRSEDGVEKRWNSETGKEIPAGRQRLPGTAVLEGGFSPDGRRSVIKLKDKPAELWDDETGRRLATLKEDTSVGVSCVAFSPDGQRLVAASGVPSLGGQPAPLTVYDAHTGREIFTLLGHTDRVKCLSFSPDDRRLVSTATDGTARVWDAVNGQGWPAMQAHHELRGLAMHPDGNRFLTLGNSRGGGKGDLPGARLWDAVSGQAILTTEGPINVAAFGADGKMVATALKSADAANPYAGRLQLCDAGTLRQLRVFAPPAGPISSLAFSPDGKRLLTGGLWGRVRLWDVHSGEPLLSLGDLGGRCQVTFSPDGSHFVAGGSTEAVLSKQTAQLSVWDVETGQQVATMRGQPLHVNAVCYSPDGKRIVSGGGDWHAPGVVQVWDAETGEEVLTLKGHASEVHGVACSPDGSRIFSASGDDAIVRKYGELKVWDAQTGQELLHITHPSAITLLALGADGARLVVGDAKGALTVWAALKKQEDRLLTGHGHPVACVAFSPDGRFLVSGTGSTQFKAPDGEVKVWDVRDGRELRSLLQGGASVNSVAYSPDGGRVLAACADGMIRVWDAQTGAALLAIKAAGELGVRHAAYSPDGQRIVSCGDGVKVWDADTGRELLKIANPPSLMTGCNQVVFSADGKRVFGWGREADDEVRAWSADSGAPAEADDPPPRPSFCSDGRHLALGTTLVDLAVHEGQNGWPLPDRTARRQYHGEQAALAEENKHWFAAAFHLGRLLLDEPDNADLQKRHDEASRNHANAEKKP